MQVIKVIFEIIVPCCVGYMISMKINKRKWKREAEELIKQQKESYKDFNFDDMED